MSDDDDQHGEPVSELTTLFGISRSTLFRTPKSLEGAACTGVSQSQRQGNQVQDDDPYEVIPSALDADPWDHPHGLTADQWGYVIQTTQNCASAATTATVSATAHPH